MLLQQRHDWATKAGIQPYEAVSETVRDMGARLRLSESTFPISILLPMLEKYAFEYQRNVGPPTWIIDIFLYLQVPYERLFSVLEAMIYNNEVPFHGSNRRVLANDLVYLIQKWFQETARAGGPLFDSAELALQVDEVLILILQLGGDDQRSQTCRVLRERIAQILH